MPHSREAGGSEATVPVPGATGDIYSSDEAAGLDPAYRAKATLLNNAIQEMGKPDKLGKYQVRP